jgi:hypothetical protein
MRYLRGAGAFVVAATLAVPAAAEAHPSVYTGEARVVPPGLTPPIAEGDLDTQTRYMVTNHGFTYVLTESNGEVTNGVMAYNMLPGAYRNQPNFEPVPGTRTRLLAEGDTGAQAHATCRGVPALAAESAILAWQEPDDPFYNYVPFQKESAGLEDPPAAWIDDVEALTGVDLATVANPAEACAGLGGTYVPADTMQTTAASLAGGTVAAATEPLNAQLTGLQSSLTAAQSDLAAARTELAAARAELARVMPLTRTFAVTLPTARVRASALRSNGLSVTLSGPPLQTVALRLSIPTKAAKQIGLKSGLLARTTASIGAGGSAQATLEPSARVKRALRRLRGSAALTLSAAGGDRTDSVSGRVTR